MTRTTRPIAVVAIVLLVVGGGAFALITAGQTAQNDQTPDAASIELTMQPSDNRTVIVDSVTLPEGGYVVVHDTLDLEAGLERDSVIGTSAYLEAGTHEDVPVTLTQPVQDDSMRVTAMAHTDSNGDEAFGFLTADGDVDGPYTTSAAATTATPPGTETATPPGTETATPPGTATVTETTMEPGSGTSTPADVETSTATPGVTGTPSAGDQPVTATATVMFGEESGPATNLEFSDQSMDGMTVTVDRVTLYRGGYVVVHAPSLDQNSSPRTVLGSTDYMAPGTYEDVEVTLSKEVEDSMTLEEGRITLNAVPHHEENGNDANDFLISGGATDEPYEANGSVVNASATVSLEGSGGTATPSTTTPSTMTPSTPTSTPTG